MIVLNEFRPDMRVYNEAIMLKRQKNYKVTILALKKSGKLPDSEIMQGGIEVKRVTVPNRELYMNFFSPLYRTSIVPMLYNQAKSEGADIYCCHDIYTLPVGIKLKRLENVPVVYDAHEPNYGTFLSAKPMPGVPGKVREVFANSYERTAANKTDTMFVTTEFARSIKQKKGYAVPIHVIPYRANPAYFNPEIHNKSLEGKYEDKRVVIFIGNIGETKGFFEMMEAFKIIKQKEKRSHLLIVGEVVSWLKPEETIKELGLSDSVEITGYLPYWEVSQYINTADVGLMLSRETMENYNLTLPNKVIDYMACGIPFVASRLKQVEKIVSEEECGILVDSTNPKEISDAVLRLFKNPEEARAMGKRGLEGVKSTYSWAGIEQELNKIYDGITKD
jgi:glycosyltransferase involved in cell wall biosynthesis